MITLKPISLAILIEESLKSMSKERERRTEREEKDRAENGDAKGGCRKLTASLRPKLIAVIEQRLSGVMD